MRKFFLSLIAASVLFTLFLSGCRVGADNPLDSVTAETAARPAERRNDGVWLAIDAYGRCIVTNAKGETLVNDCGAPSGDLEILESRIVPFGGIKNDCAVSYYRVEESECFTFTTEADAAGFEVIWDGYYQDFSGTGIERVAFTSDSIQAEGRAMDYEIEVSAGLDTYRYIAASGTAASNVSYQGREEVLICADTAYRVVAYDMYASSVLLTLDAPAGVGTTVKDAATEFITFELVESSSASPT